MQERIEYREFAFAHGVEVWRPRPQNEAMDLLSCPSADDCQIGITTVAEKAVILLEEAVFCVQGGLTVT